MKIFLRPQCLSSTNGHICHGDFNRYYRLLTDVFSQHASTAILIGHTGTETGMEVEISVLHWKLQSSSEKDSILTGFSRRTAASRFQL